MKRFASIIIALCAILTTAAAQTPDTRLPDDGASATETSVAPVKEELDMTPAEEAYDAAPWKNLQIEPRPADPGCLSRLDGQNTLITILIMVLILVTGIVIGIIILRCGKLFHRVSRLEEHMGIPGDYIKLKVPDEADPVEPEGREDGSESIPGEPEDDNALNGNHEHDNALIRHWIQRIDDAFPYEITPPGEGFYAPCDHPGPNGEKGKAWAMRHILTDNIIDDDEVSVWIERGLKEDLIHNSRARVIRDMYGHNNIE